MGGSNRVQLRLGLIFGGIGLVAATIALVLWLRIHAFNSSAERVEGVVTAQIVSPGTRGRLTVAPRFAYTVEGKTYVKDARVSSNPPAFSVGDKVQVMYPRDNPADGRIDSFWENWFFVLLTGFFGALFGGLGASFFLVARAAVKRRERAMNEGRRVMATVQEVRLNTRYRSGGRSPYVIVATHEGRTFVSENLWKDPTPRVPPGSEVPVYCVPDEPKVYAFDLKALLEG